MLATVLKSGEGLVMLLASRFLRRLSIDRLRGSRILEKLADEGKIRKKSGGRYASYQLALPEAAAGSAREK